MTRTSARHGPYWDKPIETLDRECLRARQLQALRTQVERCYEASALYRRRLAAVGMEPGDLHDLADYARLPPVTKDELRADQAEFPAFGSFAVAQPDQWAEVHPSTGTTGAPVNTLWSRRDVALITDMTARTLWQFGVRPGDVVQNAFAYGLWVAGLGAHYGCAEIGATVIPIGTGVTTQKQLDYLLTARSTVLLSTPSYAVHIAEHLDGLGRSAEELSLRLGGFGGEAGAATPATRAFMESRLGIDAFDFYGLAEVGPTFASECEAKAGLHFAEDHVLVECLDADTGERVDDGEIGVLVLSHLTREASPMLRYWTNDYARLDSEPCLCGRTHVRAVGGILGRHDDLVVFKGAKFYPSQVEGVVRRLADLSPEYRIEVEREDGGARLRSCTVVVEWARGPRDHIHEQLRAGLRAALGVTPAIRIEPAGTLARSAFKAVRIVDTAG